MRSCNDRPGRGRKLFCALALLVSALGAMATPPAYAGAPFVVNADGTVTDASTGLMWDQCALGLSGAGCATGTVLTLSWGNALGEAATRSAANYKGYSDWRVPSVVELQTLVKLGSSPTIDTTAFPNTPASNFWSGSSWIGPTAAWYVYFTAGGTGAGNKTNENYVRLVRGGQYFGSFALVLGGVSGITATAATLTATTSPVGATGYWMVVPRGAASPAPAQIIAGAGYNGVTVVAGNGAMVATTPKLFAVSGLAAGTDYDLYLVAKESTYATTSNVTGPQQFSTLGPFNTFDVDGDTRVDALTDGLILLRYMFGLREPSLTAGALGAGATRSPAQIESYMQSVMP